MPSGMPEATTQQSAGGPATGGSSTTAEAVEERISYVVQAGETMNAIAAKFDMTPSELARLNRISVSSMLFEGRKLSIPVSRQRRSGSEDTSHAETDQVTDDKDSEVFKPSDDPTQNAKHTAESDPKSTDVPINTQQNSGKDILSNLMMPPRIDSSQSQNETLSAAVPTRHRLSHVLKISARHITDGQGVVTGTLLITPNNLMFSPNVSDLIVIEHGTEHYEVTAPIDMIAGAALYTDIAIMRTKLHQKPVVCNIPVQVYYSDDARPKTPPSSPNKLAAEPRQGSDSGSEPVSPRPTKTPPSSPIVNARQNESKAEGQPARTDSRDMEEPEVFAALERLLPKQAQPQENSMLYLCLRMGKPLNKVVKVPAVAIGRKKLRFEYWFGIPRNRVDEVYKFFQRNYPEKYGDVIELNMAERGFAEIESDDEDSDSEQKDSPVTKDGRGEGHEDVKLPETPPRSADGALTGVLNRVGSFKNPFKLPRFFEGPNTPHPSFSSCEWEVIAFKEDKDAPNQTSSTNLLSPLTPDEILLPEMVDESEILDEEHRKMLYKVIPARAEGYAWRLVYSTTRHGFSLKTFYREMSRHDGPVLLAITDTEGALFGAFASTTIHPSDHFYGTGEMFLWSFYPSFNKYSWSGDNQYFVKGNQDSLVFGSGDGEFGLYLDGDLYHGRSSTCKTFNNEVLSKTNDFVIKSLEAWGFF